MLVRTTIKKKNRRKQIRSIPTVLDILQKAVDLAKAKGAPTWFTIPPLTELVFTLHKSPIHDALALQYDWTPTCLPSKRECDNIFNVEPVLS